MDSLGCISNLSHTAFVSNTFSWIFFLGIIVLVLFILKLYLKNLHFLSVPSQFTSAWNIGTCLLTLDSPQSCWPAIEVKTMRMGNMVVDLFLIYFGHAILSENNPKKTTPLVLNLGPHGPLPCIFSSQALKNTQFPFLQPSNWNDQSFLPSIWIHLNSFLLFICCQEGPKYKTCSPKHTVFSDATFLSCHSVKPQCGA